MLLDPLAPGRSADFRLATCVQLGTASKNGALHVHCIVSKMLTRHQAPRSSNTNATQREGKGGKKSACVRFCGWCIGRFSEAGLLE